MPPQITETTELAAQPTVSKSKKGNYFLIVTLLLIVGVAAYLLGLNQKHSVAGVQGTKVFYSPATKEVFIYSTLGPFTAEEKKRDLRLDMPSKVPRSADILLMDIPYQTAAIEHATTTGAGEMFFSVTANLVDSPVFYSKSKIQGQIQQLRGSRNEATFYYDPATNTLKSVTNSSLSLVSIAPDGELMRFKKSCSSCDSFINAAEFIWDSKKGWGQSVDGDNADTSVLEFEWLGGDKYRYKKRIMTDSGKGTCTQVVGGDMCWIPAEQVEWIYREII